MNLYIHLHISITQLLRIYTRNIKNIRRETLSFQYGANIRESGLTSVFI